MSPSRAFRVVRERQPLEGAIATALFVFLVFGYTWLPNPQRVVEAIFELDRGSVSRGRLISVGLAASLGALVIEAAFIHLVAIVFRGKGRYGGVFCGLCFACFPLAFFAPLALLRASLASLSGHFVYFIGSWLLVLWVLFLAMFVIRENYGFSRTRALLVGLIPAVVTFVVPPLVIAACSGF